ncbi:hypothetical protein FQN55_001074 [Onygenales sp. PD_40]|nr:hypothetical protein FQN55_001074 [Onygenales sp. PD_40]KAK2800750.1 hypothetical protein FQN51_005890 [Onygenales sp. PD_10]
MSRVSAEEQFSFLISCVKHSNNGKVDFTEVAKECNIVTKGAAAKRYERMMKANGINPNGGSPIPYTDTDTQDANGTTPKTPKTPKTPRSKAGGGGAGTKTPASRKRKGGAAATSKDKDPAAGSPKKVKSEPNANSDDSDGQVVVKVESKEESGVGLENGNATDGMMATADDPFFSREINAGAEEREMYGAFCDSGAKVGAGLYAGAGGSGDGENQNSYMDAGVDGEILNMFPPEAEF